MTHYGTTFSLAIYHRNDNPKRVRSLRDTLIDLAPLAHSVPTRVFDERATDTWDKWQHSLHPTVWQWALDVENGTTGQQASHHVFMTDDLHVAPGFWKILGAMTEAQPGAILGLLSNHPAGPRLAAAGKRWYRCNSWIVGPAYVVPREHLARFLPWYRVWIERVAKKSDYGDDSSLNEWISKWGPHESWHPLPTIIEHRSDLESTWQAGDCFSRERVSWRAHRYAPLRESYQGLWTTEERRYDLDAMQRAEFWYGSGPMLNVGGAREDEVAA